MLVVCHSVSVRRLTITVASTLLVIVVSSAIAWTGDVPDWERSILEFFNGWPNVLELLFWVLRQPGVLLAPLVAGLVVFVFATLALSAWFLIPQLADVGEIWQQVRTGSLGWGLGAAEAALIAAFSTIEEASIVVPAVFLYRFVTFWLPIVPGWIALTILRRTNRL